MNKDTVEILKAISRSLRQLAGLFEKLIRENK